MLFQSKKKSKKDLLKLINTAKNPWEVEKEYACKNLEELYLNPEFWSYSANSTEKVIISLNEALECLFKNYIFKNTIPNNTNLYIKSFFLADTSIFETPDTRPEMLIQVKDYYMSLAAYTLLEHNSLDNEALKKSCTVFQLRIDTNEITESEIRKSAPDLAIVFSDEFLRRLILKDYEFIINFFEENFRFNLKKFNSDIDVLIINYCYLLAKHAQNTPDLAGIDTYKALIKLSWISSVANNDFSEQTYVTLALIVYAYHLVVNNQQINVDGIASEFSIDSIESEILSTL